MADDRQQTKERTGRWWEQFQRVKDTTLEPLTEEQIEERVNGWVEKYKRYIQYRVQTGAWHPKMGQYREEHMEYCKEWWLGALGEDPSFLPKYQPGMAGGMAFMHWEEEQETN